MSDRRGLEHAKSPAGKNVRYRITASWPKLVVGSDGRRSRNQSTLALWTLARQRSAHAGERPPKRVALIELEGGESAQPSRRHRF